MPLIPAVLPAASIDPTSTATVSGSDIVATTGQVAKFAVTSPGSATYVLRFQADAPFGGRVLVKVDGVLVHASTMYTDEEGETMPYRIPVETLVTCPAGTVTRLDPSPGANRCEIVIVNTHANDRLAIARVPAGSAAPLITVDTTAKTSDRQVVEADAGVPFPERADENVAFYAKPVGINSVVVRVIQKHTA